MTSGEVSKNNNTIKKPSAKIQEEKREPKANIQEPKDKNNNTIKKPSAKIQEEKREPKANIQEPKDKDWETFLKNLQQADLHLWILLNKRKFIKWEGNAAFISVNNDSVAWKKLNQDVAKKVIETVSNACLKKKIELKIIIDKEPVLTKKKQKNNLNIEKEIEDLGIEGEWDK